jgi:hypothetical protein
MEIYRQLDSSRRTALDHALILLVALCLWPAAYARAQSSEAEIQQLFQQQRWQEIVQLAPPTGVSAEIDLEYGIALAQLGRFNRADAVLRDGLRLRPRDPRFMAELGGTAFKQLNYAKAQFWLERAVRLSPQDKYDLEFLGTIFYLEGNLDAALKFWNRMGKPRLENVKLDPRPAIQPGLLDRAFLFSPASTLELPALQTTEANLDQLDIFSSYRPDLQARAQGNFDLVLHNSERDGCGVNKWDCLLNILGESPAQTLNFDYFNIANRAINVRSAFRWDSEKRRVTAQIETPVANQTKWRFGLGADLRNENWGVLTAFSGPATLLGALNLKKEAFKARFADVMSGRWQWSTETEISDRQFHNVFAGTALTPSLLSDGFQLKQSFFVKSLLLDRPERRFTIDSNASLGVAGLWSNGGRDYAKLRGMLRLHWFPEHAGDKYELQHQFRAGKTFGDPPFDELFMLGVLGDTDLHMKAHVATRDGKKGSGPLGRNYFVSNWDFTRNFSPLSLATIKVGPWVDTGKITDPVATLGSHEWLWDAGVEAKVYVFGLGVVFSYGRDLRAGRGAFVASAP